MARPAWNIGFVRRFTSVFGPISSVFDFLTFFVTLRVLHASHDEFRSGWFVESLATQTLVVFVIRTRRLPFFRSRPSPPMIVVPAACAVGCGLLPFMPLADPPGLTASPARFFLILIGMIAADRLLVEFAKSRFSAAPPHPRQRRATPPPAP